MKMVYFKNHILINDDKGGIARVTFEDAMKIALQLNNHFALKARYERAAEMGDEDAGPREA